MKEESEISPELEAAAKEEMKKFVETFGLETAQRIISEMTAVNEPEIKQDIPEIARLKEFVSSKMPYYLQVRFNKGEHLSGQKPAERGGFEVFFGQKERIDDTITGFGSNRFFDNLIYHLQLASDPDLDPASDHALRAILFESPSVNKDALAIEYLSSKRDEFGRRGQTTMIFLTEKGRGAEIYDLLQKVDGNESLKMLADSIDPELMTVSPAADIDHKVLGRISLSAEKDLAALSTSRTKVHFEIEDDRK